LINDSYDDYLNFNPEEVGSIYRNIESGTKKIDTEKYIHMLKNILFSYSCNGGKYAFSDYKELVDIGISFLKKKKGG